MDALEDTRDIKLYRASADLLPEITNQLGGLLTDAANSGTANNHQLWIRYSSTQKLIRLLEPFQEWPQLLDPLLPRLVKPLVDAFLQDLTARRYERRSQSAAPGAAFSPLPSAVCSILNTLCLIRGLKVITRFLDSSPKYLEPMLQTLLLNQSIMTWQERYIVLLWLSHLVLTPFDLQSISYSPSQSAEDFRLPETLGSRSLPRIAEDLVSAGLGNLEAASKERDSASRLLVRIALRPDMQRLGLLGRLLRLILGRLQQYTQDPATSTYECLGLLSIISGIVKSGSADDVSPFLANVFDFCIGAATGASTENRKIRASAPARKTLITILRTVTTHAISVGARSDLASQTAEKSYDMIEETVQFLLDAVGDKDTPVRFAASKALSVLSQKIDVEMKMEVVQAVLDSLEVDVLYQKTVSGDAIPPTLLTAEDMQKMSRNITAVDPLRWQGLLLTLGHFLFRRTAPVAQLPMILRYLLSGLDFEQRSPSGSSLGGSVRDAACFGFWSLARKYATSELQSIQSAKVLQATNSTSTASELSVLQVVANHLVISACLDPSGNIRRGSSAALQELVGRHPDVIVAGIGLVQVVDYHAVARRSRAMLDIAQGAAELAPVYRQALLSALFGWQGITAVDDASRRNAAVAVSRLLSQEAFSDRLTVLNTAHTRIRRLSKENSRSVAEARHGLLLLISRMLDSLDLANVANLSSETHTKVTDHLKLLWDGLLTDSHLLGSLKARFISELVLEGVASLIHSLARAEPRQPMQSPQQAIEVLDACLIRADQDVTLSACADAALALFRRLPGSEKDVLIAEWLDPKSRRQAPYSCKGRILVLGMVYETLSSEEKSHPSKRKVFASLKDFIQGEWPIETQVVALRSLASTIPHLREENPQEPLCAGLDNYTNDQRGDTGSLARLQAVKAVADLLKEKMENTRGKFDHHHTRPLIQKVFRLAGEKLDKLRFEAWRCIEIYMRTMHIDSSRRFSHVVDVSSERYFLTLLQFLRIPWLRASILQGCVHSMTSGTEDLMHATRLALIQSISNTAFEYESVLETLVMLLEESHGDDRQAVPLLETVAFLMEQLAEQAGEGGRKLPTKKLWNVVRKSHFKSTNIRKLEAAIRIYAALALQSNMRSNALGKLRDLLLHPYPNIRNVACDALYIELPRETLLEQDWSRPPNELKEVVRRFSKEVDELSDDP